MTSELIRLDHVDEPVFSHLQSHFLTHHTNPRPVFVSQTEHELIVIVVLLRLNRRSFGPASLKFCSTSLAADDLPTKRMTMRTLKANNLNTNDLLRVEMIIRRLRFCGALILDKMSRKVEKFSHIHRDVQLRGGERRDLFVGIQQQIICLRLLLLLLLLNTLLAELPAYQIGSPERVDHNC